MPGIEGKVVAVTGAGSGIGRATALLLAKRRAKLVLGARRLDRLEALAAAIVEAGGEAVCIATDVTQRADLTALVALAHERYARLDVLVSNAGIGPVSRFDALCVDDWEASCRARVSTLRPRMRCARSPRRCVRKQGTACA